MRNLPSKTELISTAQHLCRPGHGILAADESVSTIGKRLLSKNLPNTPETRRQLRQLLLTAPGNESAYAGIILFSETLTQSTDDGTPFVDVLQSRGILPGIKVDTGLRPVADSPGETFTSGLDDLQERCEVFFRQGARFAKWRAALRIDVDRGLPSADAIRENADTLAKYAHVAQKCGLVPMVEPEILIDGTHTQAVSAKVARLVISAVYDALKREEVCLEASLLKPMMIMPGLTCPTRGDMTPDSVARATIEVMKDVVPECVPGIMFLSGGMSEIQATSNLNALNLMAREDGGVKWRLSFSYGRALQTSVLEVWKGEDGNRDAAMKVACELGRANGRASDGEFCGIHPSRGGGELYEGFRGWREEEGKANGV